MSLTEKLRWRFYRLSCMSASEVLHRTSVSWQSYQQSRRKHWQAPTAEFALPSLGYTVPSLDPAPYQACADEIMAGQISVLGKAGFSLPSAPNWHQNVKSEHVLPSSFGKFIDYRDTQRLGDIKYVWVPNRHNHWVSVAQAYALSQDARYLRYLEAQLDSWLDQNPPYQGPCWISSLELSLRLINWALVWLMIGGEQSMLFQSEKGQALKARWLDSIYWHVEFIQAYYSRHSSANNHLLGELAGVVIAACVWPLWSDVLNWKKAALAELEHEACFQTAEDGVNKEQSTFYHGFVLEFLLLTDWFLQKQGEGFSQQSRDRMVAMGRFYDALMIVSGQVPAIGDADDGKVVYLSPEAENLPLSQMLSLAIAYDAPDLARRATELDHRNHWLLADQALPDPSSRTRSEPLRLDFPLGGYAVLGTDFDQPDEIKAVFDAGSLGFLSIAAHGHADALSFNLSVGGVPFLLDIGTFAYQSEVRWRDYFRGTAGHNTVCVDQKNQSEILGKFMWRAHADAYFVSVKRSVEMDEITAEHLGYRRLTDPVTHQRQVVFERESRHYRVTDTLKASGEHHYALHWHISPDLDVSIQCGQLVIESDTHRVCLSFEGSEQALSSAEIVSGDESLPLGWQSPQFMQRRASPSLRLQWKATGEQQITTKIEVQSR